MAERRCFLSSTPKTTKKKQFLVILHERFYEKSVRSDTVASRAPDDVGNVFGGGANYPTSDRVCHESTSFWWYSVKLERGPYMEDLWGGKKFTPYYCLVDSSAGGYLFRVCMYCSSFVLYFHFHVTSLLLPCDTKRNIHFFWDSLGSYLKSTILLSRNRRVTFKIFTIRQSIWNPLKILLKSS